MVWWWYLQTNNACGKDHDIRSSREVGNRSLSCSHETGISWDQYTKYLWKWQSISTKIIIIIIIIISFMQGIYTYIPESNYVPREYSVAAILLLLFMVLISLVSVLNLLYFYISTFRSMCVQWPIWLTSVVPSLHVFPVCCSCIFWMTMK